MNKDTNTSPSDAKTPANVDDIMQKCLNRTAELIEGVEARELCALGSLVLKIKTAQTEAAASPTQTKCVTEETINEAEQNGHDL